MSTTQPVAGEVLRFGIFELDGAAGELRRNGSVVRLAPQPFQVLQLLAQHSGTVVDRDRIRREVWGATAVDFDRSLNVCVAQVRAALNDDADSPRFIQTLPRRGYRFLAAVERVGGTPVEVAPQPVMPGPGRRWILAAALVAVVLALTGYALMRQQPGVQPLRLAVLPFDALGSTGSADAQIEGLFDELLTRLSGIQPDRLRVIGRRSVARYGKERRPLREIGERLQAGYALEGTVRQETAGLRVAIRLVEAGGETVLWSGGFDQQGPAAEFEEKFVASVSAAVVTRLFPEAAPSSREQGCGEGWEAYRTGRLLVNRGTIAGLRKSVPYFEKAGCAAAREALAVTWSHLARTGQERGESWEAARKAAREALEKEPRSAGAHAVLGNVAMWRDWDWKTAGREFQAALRGNPSDAEVHHDEAWLLMALGRRHEAVSALERSIAMDPLSPRINIHAGWLLLQAGRFREAAAQARRALELEPEMAEARACLSRALLYAGDDRAALEAIRPVAPEAALQAVKAMPPSQAVRALFRASIGEKGAMDPYQRAWRLAWLGSREEALAEIEEGYRRRSSMMPMLGVDPAFAALRGEARFRKVVRDLGL